jgi:hypothetical protein
VMAEVSAKLMGKFAENLQELLAEEQAGDNAAQADTEDDAAATEPVDADEGPRKIDMPEAEAVDLLDAAGASVFKRVLPIAGVAALLLILRRLFRKG